MKTIFEKSHPGRSTAYFAAAGPDEKPAASFLPPGSLRAKPPGLPEVSELEKIGRASCRERVYVLV